MEAAGGHVSRCYGKARPPPLRKLASARGASEDGSGARAGSLGPAGAGPWASQNQWQVISGMWQAKK